MRRLDQEHILLQMIMLAVAVVGIYILLFAM